MTRKEFIRLCGILGIALPFSSTLLACKKEDEELSPSSFSGKVIIVGAGPGGLSAGYFLNQLGIDFEILEASAHYGGRIKTNKQFTDFPIPMGAEWIETDLGIFHRIVNNPSVKVDVSTFKDSTDSKFLNGTWLTFYEKYVLPSIANKIKFNTVVSSVDYSGSKVVIKSNQGNHEADKAIISVPLKVLQDGDISFSPSLPQSKQNAINNANIWAGFKAFFEFSNNFYGNGHEFKVTPKTDGEKLYYNAAFGQNTSKNILGLFVVGKPAEEYVNISGDELKNHILKELDALFNNQATPNYKSYVVQNWNNEPFVKAGYLSDHEDWKLVKELGNPVGNKIYFAGGAYTDGEDWVSVHTAALSAKVAVGNL